MDLDISDLILYNIYLIFITYTRYISSQVELSLGLGHSFRFQFA